VLSVARVVIGRGREETADPLTLCLFCLRPVLALKNSECLKAKPQLWRILTSGRMRIEHQPKVLLSIDK
jgi:hypothetical protein